MAVELSIELTGPLNFNAGPPLLSPREQRVYDKWRPLALQNGWIRRSTAKHSCRMFYVPKKNGDLRLCVNYIPLNNKTVRMVYAPTMSRQLRSRMTQATWYSKVDIENAFHNIPIREEDRWKTAFRTPHGVYEWNVMPFGLTNAPGVFQHYADTVLLDIAPTEIAIHIDDVLIFTETKRRCIALLEQVLQRLQQTKWPVNREKSVLVPTTTADFTGFRFTNNTCAPIVDCQTIAAWPTPRNPTELRSFLGTVNVMRDHIPRHAHLAQPLFQSTGQVWTWTPKQDQAFRDLRKKATEYIKHTRYDPTKKSVITTDASLFAVAAWHTQDDKPIAIWSRALKPAERNYTADERELLGVVDALKTWQYDLELSPGILIRTDNEINTATLKESQTNRRKNRWIEYLMQYQLTWQHIPGVKNPADSPSRRPDYKKGPSVPLGGKGT